MAFSFVVAEGYILTVDVPVTKMCIRDRVIHPLTLTDMAKRNSKTAAQQCRYYEVDNIFVYMVERIATITPIATRNTPFTISLIDVYKRQKAEFALLYIP